MKQKIADWMFNFWYNNHTHYWIAYEQNTLKQKCRDCGIIKL